VTAPPPESAIWDRVLRFGGADRVSLQAVASRPFYSILAHAFGEGFRIGAIDPKGVEIDAFHRYRPEMGTTSLRTRLIQIATNYQQGHEKRLGGSLFTAMTIEIPRGNTNIR
jgi:hypothetical protein